MALVRVCDLCGKRITNHSYVEAGVGPMRIQAFHVRCAPAIVQFLTKIHAPGIEELLARPESRRQKG